MEGKMSSPIRGITGLFISVKVVFCLIVLAASTTLIACKLLDSASYAAIIGSISTMFIYAHHKVQIAAMQISAANSPPPPPNLMGDQNK